MILHVLRDVLFKFSLILLFPFLDLVFQLFDVCKVNFFLCFVKEHHLLYFGRNIRFEVFQIRLQKTIRYQVTDLNIMHFHFLLNFRFLWVCSAWGKGLVCGKCLLGWVSFSAWLSWTKMTCTSRGPCTWIIATKLSEITLKKVFGVSILFVAVSVDQMQRWGPFLREEAESHSGANELGQPLWIYYQRVDFEPWIWMVRWRFGASWCCLLTIVREIKSLFVFSIVWVHSFLRCYVHFQIWYHISGFLLKVFNDMHNQRCLNSIKVLSSKR